jgi:hypothetical protein
MQVGRRIIFGQSLLVHANKMLLGNSDTLKMISVAKGWEKYVYLPDS